MKEITRANQLIWYLSKPVYFGLLSAAIMFGITLKFPLASTLLAFIVPFIYDEIKNRAKRIEKLNYLHLRIMQYLKFLEKIFGSINIDQKSLAAEIYSEEYLMIDHLISKEALTL